MILTIIILLNLLSSKPIIGGKIIKDSEFPEVILLGTNEGICTASYIGPNTILTAAHCVSILSSSTFSFDLYIEFENRIKQNQTIDSFIEKEIYASYYKLIKESNKIEHKFIKEYLAWYLNFKDDKQVGTIGEFLKSLSNNKTELEVFLKWHEDNFVENKDYIVNLLEEKYNSNSTFDFKPHSFPDENVIYINTTKKRKIEHFIYSIIINKEDIRLNGSKETIKEIIVDQASDLAIIILENSSNNQYLNLYLEQPSLDQAITMVGFGQHCQDCLIPMYNKKRIGTNKINDLFSINDIGLIEIIGRLDFKIKDLFKYDRGKSSAAMGDSGGPIIINDNNQYKILGIMSHIIPCKKGNYYEIRTSEEYEYNSYTQDALLSLESNISINKLHDFNSNICSLKQEIYKLNYSISYYIMLSNRTSFFDKARALGAIIP